MRTRALPRYGAALAATLAVLALGTGPADAAPGPAPTVAHEAEPVGVVVREASPTAAPFEVDGEITDPDGALGDRTDEVRGALDRLSDATPYRLLVVYVDSFDGMTGVDWAKQTASDSGLGVNDLLLAVATGDRRYGIAVDVQTALSDVDLARIDAATSERLASDDWAGAAIAAADTTRELVAGPPGDSGSGPASSPTLPILLAVLALGAVVVVAVLVARRRSGAAPAAGPTALTTLATTELARRADAALDAARSVIHTAEGRETEDPDHEETGPAAPTAGALDAARTDLAAALAERREVDDPGVPESRRRQVLAQVVTRCARIERSLEAVPAPDPAGAPDA